MNSRHSFQQNFLTESSGCPRFEESYDNPRIIVQWRDTKGGTQDPGLGIHVDFGETAFQTPVTSAGLPR